MGKKVKAIRKSKTGRNTHFQVSNGRIMTSLQFIKRIKKKEYPKHHVSKDKNGKEYARSNPDKNKNNNLG